MAEEENVRINIHSSYNKCRTWSCHKYDHLRSTFSLTFFSHNGETLAREERAKCIGVHFSPSVAYLTLIETALTGNFKQSFCISRLQSLKVYTHLLWRILSVCTIPIIFSLLSCNFSQAVWNNFSSINKILKPIIIFQFCIFAHLQSSYSLTLHFSHTLFMLYP